MWNLTKSRMISRSWRQLTGQLRQFLNLLLEKAIAQRQCTSCMGGIVHGLLTSTFSNIFFAFFFAFFCIIVSCFCYCSLVLVMCDELHICSVHNPMWCVMWTIGRNTTVMGKLWQLNVFNSAWVESSIHMSAHFFCHLSTNYIPCSYHSGVPLSTSTWLHTIPNLSTSPQHQLQDWLRWLLQQPCVMTTLLQWLLQQQK